MSRRKAAQVDTKSPLRSFKGEIASQSLSFVASRVGVDMR